METFFAQGIMTYRPMPDLCHLHTLKTFYFARLNVIVTTQVGASSLITRWSERLLMLLNKHKVQSYSPCVEELRNAE